MLTSDPLQEKLADPCSMSLSLLYWAFSFSLLGYFPFLWFLLFKGFLWKIYILLITFKFLEVRRVKSNSSHSPVLTVNVSDVKVLTLPLTSCETLVNPSRLLILHLWNSDNNSSCPTELSCWLFQIVHVKCLAHCLVRSSCLTICN